MLAPAKEACVELLADESAAPCDRCDLEALARAMGEARGYLVLGEAREASEQIGEARQAYVKALAIDTSLDTAREALVGLGEAESDEPEEATPAQSDEARQLDDLVEVGAVATAKDQLRELVKDNPGLAEEMLDDDELKHLADGRLPWWRAFLYSIEPWARLVLEIVALFVIVLAVLRVVPPLQPLRALLMRRLLPLIPTVRIGELKTSGLETEIGGGFAALLASRLSQSPEVGSAPYTMVTKSMEPLEFPAEVGTVLPALSILGVLPALLRWLSLRREIEISGTLYKGGHRGAAATLTVSEANRVVQTKTFTERHLPVAPSSGGEDDLGVFYLLADHAAVWLTFALQQARSGKELEVMGTTSWESYAFFLAGLRTEGVLRD